MTEKGSTRQLTKELTGLAAAALEFVMDAEKEFEDRKEETGKAERIHENQQ